MRLPPSLTKLRLVREGDLRPAVVPCYVAAARGYLVPNLPQLVSASNPLTETPLPEKATPAHRPAPCASPGALLLQSLPSLPARRPLALQPALAGGAPPPTVVAASLPALAAAEQLECLCLLQLEPALDLEGYRYVPPDEHWWHLEANAWAAQLAVIEWASHRPSLRRLSLGGSVGKREWLGPFYNKAQLTEAIQQAAAASPQLRIEISWDMHREFAQQTMARQLVE